MLICRLSAGLQLFGPRFLHQGIYWMDIVLLRHRAARGHLRGIGLHQHSTPGETALWPKANSVPQV